MIPSCRLSLICVSSLLVCGLPGRIAGTCGNVAVLTTIYHVVRSRRSSLDNTLIYVIVLSCVDFGVCLSLPFTVIDQASAQKST